MIDNGQLKHGLNVKFIQEVLRETSRKKTLLTLLYIACASEGLRDTSSSLDTIITVEFAFLLNV